MLAIIGGSGLAQLSSMRIINRKLAVTPYGSPSDALSMGLLGDTPCIFLARHGTGHSIAPHDINYRANIWALREAGATFVLSIASVGGITLAYVPGALAVPHQIVDYTWGRKHTFFDQGAPVTHVDFTEPYTEKRRATIIGAARMVGEYVLERGVYAVTQGPRLESAAEIDRLERDGADMVGMTAMPEAALSKEAGIDYASIVVVANHAAGRGDSKRAIDMAAIHAVHATSMRKVVRIVEAVAEEMK